MCHASTIVFFFFGFGAMAPKPKKKRNTGPYQFLDSYVSLRHNFADGIRSSRSLTLKRGPDPKMCGENATL